MSLERFVQSFPRAESLFDDDYDPKAKALFRVATGAPRAYFELPQTDGQPGRYVYHVLGFKSRGRKVDLERHLLGALFNDLKVARAQLEDDYYLPWIIERRKLEICQEADFETDIVWTKINWRICIPGVDMTQLRSTKREHLLDGDGFVELTF